MVNIEEILQIDRDKSIRVLAQRPELVYKLNKSFINEEFIKTVCKDSPYFLSYLPENMITKELLMDCIEDISANSIGNVISKFTSQDKKYAIELLKKDYFTLKFMPDEIKDDFDLIFSITNGFTGASTIYENSSKRIQNTKEYVLKFLELNYMCFECIPDKFKRDKDVMLHILKNHWDALNDMPYHIYLVDELLNDKDIAQYAIGIIKFEHLPKHIKDDYNLLKKAIKVNEKVLEYLPINILISLGYHDIAEKYSNEIDFEKYLNEESSYMFEHAPTLNEIDSDMADYKTINAHDGCSIGFNNKYIKIDKLHINIIEKFKSQLINAKGVLINFTANPSKLEILEISKLMESLKSIIDIDCELISSHMENNSMIDNEIMVSLLITGLEDR